MKYTLADILIALGFMLLIIGSNMIQSGLKNDIQLYLILFGLVSLASLFSNGAFKTKLPFYILLGIMLYVNIFMLTNYVVNKLQADNAWITDNNGQKHRIMQWQWLWGALSGIIISPLLVLFYHTKIKSNKIIERAYIIMFISASILIYVKHKLHF